VRKYRTRQPADEQTGVDDVRRVREKIAKLYKGDVRRHMLDTARIVRPLMEKLGLKHVAPDAPTKKRNGASVRGRRIG
jgi:hypothetical protein